MMDNKWSYSRRLLPPITSAVLLLAVGLLCSRPAAATDLPTWLRQAAKETLPAVTPETIAVILYDEQETTVQANGEVETTYRRAYMILRPAGKDLGVFGVHFDNETKITWMKAWCIPKDGKEYEVKEKDAVETGLTEEFYSDDRYKVMEIPAALPGNVIGYEYHQKQRPFFLQDEWRIQSTLPARRSRFTLNLPSGWEHTEKWMHYPDQKPLAETPSTVTWEVENVPAIKLEPLMPDRRAVAARMGVTFHPPSGGTSALGPTNWDQIGVWHAQLASGSLQPTPDIQQKVKELTANAATWREKTQLLGSYVQSRVRYIDIEIGIGGFKPHPAGDIYKHQYGDCKDKATLLSAMLHEAGIPSYLALAQTERGVVAPDFASAITFNHVILAIPVPADASVDGYSAVVNTSKFGKMLIFDPTSEYTPFGYLPYYEQENYILVSTPEGGELVHLPLSDPAVNRLVRTAKLELHSDGSLSGAVVETRSGNEATTEREMLLNSNSTDRTKQLESFLGTFLQGFHLTKASAVNMEKVGEPLELRYEFTADRYAKSAGDLLIVRARVVGQKGTDVAEGDDPRKLPVVFDDTSLQTDDFEITLPPGYTVDDLPRPTKSETEFASYSSQTQVAGNIIHYTRTYQVKQVLVPADKMDELRKFNRQIAGDERASVVLKRATQ
jgi:hypothetical protein